MFDLRPAEPEISDSLEDYLETIHNLQKTRKVARVKDIARERKVRMASVSTAMRRLQELGLIIYSQREYIELSEHGQEVVRRILVRHEILRRFLSEFLQVSPETADSDACQIEHHVSDETVDRFVRLLEFLETCTEGRRALAAFQSCPEVGPEHRVCDETCERRAGEPPCTPIFPTETLSDLAPGERGLIAKIRAGGALRQRLIDMGMLPHTEVEVERVAPSGDPIWIKLRGFQLSLRKEEAQGILVSPI
jgi:DtxR family Mn-dependent transcriptional regulator